MPKNNIPFSEKVKSVVQKIPRGKTMTYKHVAIKAGNPNGARAVARVMSTNVDPTVPCHRVLRSDGGLGGYNIAVRSSDTLSKELRATLKKVSYTLHSPCTGIDIKRKVLQNEGIIL